MGLSGESGCEGPLPKAIGHRGPCAHHGGR